MFLSRRIPALMCSVIAIGAVAMGVTAAADTTVAHQDELWVLENGQLRVTVDAQAGTLSVRDKASGHEWQQAPAGASKDDPKLRHVREVANPSPGIAFEADFGSTGGKPNTISVTLTMPADASDLFVEADMRDRDAEVGGFRFLNPFVLDSSTGVLVVADYSNGHLYPLDAKPFPRGRFSASRLDMPWVGVCDLQKGVGYALIIETSDDAYVECRKLSVGGRELVAPQVGWTACKGKFAYPRRLIYHFAPRDGYIALAKRYRAYARRQGLVVPFAEKLKKNPNIRRLFGAPDVWGDASESFARQAKAAGVEKMLIHGRSSPESMKAINELGYLTSEYDNYTDILPVEPGKEISSNRDHLPDSAVMNADGKRKTAWLTFDKKKQYMKRCPARWVTAAKVVVPKVLKTHPFVGRFIDVTTAENLYECYDPEHPLTHGQKRECGVALLGYVRSQGLVVGGEHGIWWAVPQLDYIEGMMSGGSYSWPAGHLKHPKSKDEAFTSPWGHKYGKWEGYAKWGIGHQYRVPLWELVFHDCIVSTWYWGDATDWLLEAAPEITPKKDAFNVLYGTIPLMWANAAGSWQAARDVFLRTYRNTCKLHEVIAGTEMLSHEFVTPDRAVQRTRFSDSTEVIVNFGQKPFAAQLAGEDYLLPQNGFAVKGPLIEQSLALVDGRPVTSIRTADYLFTDADGAGAEITMRRTDDEQIHIHVGVAEKPVLLRPCKLVPKWDAASTRLFLLDVKGRRTGAVEPRRPGEAFEFGPCAEPSAIQAVCGSKAALPDLRFAAAGPVISPERPEQGQPVEFTATVRNGGGAAAEAIEVAFYADACLPARKLASQTISLAPDTEQVVRVRVDALPIDGPRRILAVADPENKIEELCELNNRCSHDVEVTPDFSRWPHRRALLVEAGEIERENEPVVLPLDLPGVDPASVRVVECDGNGDLGAQVPAQLDAEDGHNELCFLLTGQTSPGATRRFAVLWADAPSADSRSAFFTPPQTLWDPQSEIITAKTYQAQFQDGMLTELAATGEGVVGKPFIGRFVFSSETTGWSSEPGTVERFETLHSGPARAVILVRKALKAGVVYEKTYTFYPRRFDLTVSVNKHSGGLYSRAQYLQAGQYADDQGFRATVDGKGDGENVIGKNRNPKWYALCAPRWAHSCIAISRFSSITYWDNSSHWGEIGLTTGATDGVRMSYVIHPGASDAGFAAEDYRRLTVPPKARLE